MFTGSPVARLLFHPDIARRKNQQQPGKPSPQSMMETARQLHQAFPQPVRLFGLMDGAVGERLRRIFREIEESSTAAEHAVHGELLLLLADVIRHHARQKTKGRGASTPDRGSEIVRQAKAYLNENFDRNIHLGDVAWHLRLSEEHLARVFRQHTGETIAGVIRRMRINKAKRLLLASNESMTSITRSCGFCSLPVFSTNFKKQTGTNPLAYRDLHMPKITYPKSNIRKGRI
jgi:AraC-like DNA-binding protein